MGRKTATKTAKSPKNGNEIPLGNHAQNTGGKKGRSGRKPEWFREAYREGLVKALPHIISVAQKPSHKHWGLAVKLLTDHGIGRAPLTIRHSGTLQHNHDLTKLRDDELATLEQLLRRTAVTGRN